jgi:hypothetical protein
MSRVDALRRFGPVVLLAVGAVLVLGGFLWDVMFAGIPYQDPTPALAADYERNARRVRRGRVRRAWPC